MYILQVREDIRTRDPIQKGLLDLNIIPKKTEWKDKSCFEDIEKARERAIELIEGNFRTAGNVRIVKQVATFEAIIKVKEK